MSVQVYVKRCMTVKDLYFELLTSRTTLFAKLLTRPKVLPKEPVTSFNCQSCKFFTCFIVFIYYESSDRIAMVWESAITKPLIQPEIVIDYLKNEHARNSSESVPLLIGENSGPRGLEGL